MKKIKSNKKITHTYLSGKRSATVIIPIAIARRYGFHEPVPIIIEEKDEGIFIRKLVINY